MNERVFQCHRSCQAPARNDSVEVSEFATYRVLFELATCFNSPQGPEPGVWECVLVQSAPVAVLDLLLRAVRSIAGVDMAVLLALAVLELVSRQERRYHATAPGLLRACLAGVARVAAGRPVPLLRRPRPPTAGQDYSTGPGLTFRCATGPTGSLTSGCALRHEPDPKLHQGDSGQISRLRCYPAVIAPSWGPLVRCCLRHVVCFRCGALCSDSGLLVIKVCPPRKPSVLAIVKGVGVYERTENRGPGCQLSQLVCWGWAPCRCGPALDPPCPPQLWAA